MVAAGLISWNNPLDPTYAHGVEINVGNSKVTRSEDRRTQCKAVRSIAFLQSNQAYYQDPGA